MTAGAFTPAARAAIYEAGQGRCIGCGRTDITAQHRRARMMGGTSRDELGEAPNGLPLCGSGTTGHHGWTEHHPDLAELLGWRLTVDQDPVAAPFWTREGWRTWVVENDGTPLVAYIDESDLDRLSARLAAVSAVRGIRLAV